MIEEIHNLYGVDMMEMITKKNEMQSNVDTLKSTIQLTDLIIKGKDMELLLLQKEIQDKLQTFSRSASSELPKSASKVIHFVPGMLDMGYIHDSDRPLLSQTRRHMSHQSDDYFDPADLFDTAETQTACTLLKPAEVSTNTYAVLRCDVETQTGEEIQTNGHNGNHDYTIAYNGEVEIVQEEDDEMVSRRRRRRKERERAVEQQTVGERQSRRAYRTNRSYDED